MGKVVDLAEYREKKRPVTEVDLNDVPGYREICERIRGWSPETRRAIKSPDIAADWLAAYAAKCGQRLPLATGVFRGLSKPVLRLV